MSEKQVNQAPSVKAFKIPFMPDAGYLHLVDVGDHIIQHMTQSYDEHGQVIVVEGEKEDLWKSIPQYQDEVGPKNVIRLIEAGANAENLLTANKNNASYGDFSDMDFKTVNEARIAVPGAIEQAEKALKDFNDKFGTSLDMKQFLDLYSSGLLSKHVEGVNSAEEGSAEEGEK